MTSKIGEYDRGKSARAISECVGKAIESVSLDKSTNEISLRFGDGSSLLLRDERQSCCEHRYITTDCELGGEKGAEFVDAYMTSADSTVYRCDTEDEHEVEFLNIKTSRGTLVFETHNVHNVYYGGFSVKAWVKTK